MVNNFYAKLWRDKKVVFNPTTTSSLKKLLYKVSNLFRTTPVCLSCGREMGYWREGEPICYKCDLV